MEKSFNAYIENSIRENWELTALSDFKGVSYSYKDIARKIEKMHILMEAAGVKKGDKIAICGRNSSHWAVAFFATLTYGAVVVPILHEFKPDNIHHIVNHSESKLLFVGDVVYENIDKSKMPHLTGIILVNDFSVLHSTSSKLITPGAPQPVFRRQIPRTVPQRRCLLPQRPARRTGAHQLYIGLDRIFKRGNAALPQPVDQSEILLR